MTAPRLQSSAYPFVCPFCEIPAPVALRGQVPFVIPGRSCSHALLARRDADTKRIVVDFFPDMDAPDAASE